MKLFADDRQKRTGLTLFAMLLGIGIASPAAGQSAICYDLEDRLASLQNGGAVTNQGQFGRYDKAARKQRQQLAAAQKRARRAGCRSGGIRLFQKRACSDHTRRIKQMQRNLRKIESQRSRFVANPRRVRQEKQDLIIALGRNRCGSQYERAAARFDGNRGIFGRRRDVLDGFNEPRVRGYRTVCVRTCDGYFFPISFSTTSRYFARDEAVCKGKFPNSDVTLFYHPRDVQNAMEFARSIDGRAYGAMPYAFQYREKFDAACTFDRAQLQQVVDTGRVRVQLTPDNPRTRQVKFGQDGPIPQARPTIGLDPDSILNLAGGFRPKAQPLSPSLVGDPQIRDGQRIRQVGPKLFYGQSAARVLTSQGLTRVR